MTRIFLLSVYALTTLSALMLTIAEEFPIPTVFTVVLTPLAYVFNERQQRIRLSTRTAGLFGAIAIGLTLFELFVVAGFVEAGESTERRVLAGAHLLGYLTWISLFQHKEPRQYWWLVALGLMQVAVAAILSSTPAFGVLFFLYFFLGLWTLSVFSLFQAEQSFLVAGRSSAGLVAGSVAELNSGSGLIAQLVHHQVDEFRNSIQLDANQQWISRRFVAGVMSISLFSLLVGMAFFLLTPRMWVGQRPLFVDADNMPIQIVSGLRDDVQLGQIGQILESNAKALEVRFFSANEDKELDVERVAMACGYDEPTFRGSVMGIYENGHWAQLRESSRWKELLPPIDRIGDVRQEYVLADPSTTTLFCMQPVHGVERPGDGSMIGSDMVTGMLVRGSNGVGRKSSYEVFSVRAVPHQPRPRLRLNRDQESRQLREELLPVFRKAPTGMPKLTQLARQIRDGVPGDFDLGIAQAIESHLRESGQYEYSLKADVNDPTIDPVEDFLFNRKQGHCEYFASAMALMLRSQDIPSRLVSGYKGGEKNKYSGAFVVEQRHAHAWVEAYVDGNWYTFDPTPASRGDMVRQIGRQRSGFQALRETLVGLWSQNIVRLSLEQQVSEIYQPLLKAISAALRLLLLKFGRPGELMADFLENPSRWFSAMTFVMTFIGLILLQAARVLWNRFGPENLSFRGWLMSLLAEFRNQLLDRATGRHVDFYDRFMRVLRRAGHTRGRSQTPLEFALLIQDKLAPALATAGLGLFPSQLIERFYGIRFGNQQLAEDELAQLQSQLASFEAVLNH